MTPAVIPFLCLELAHYGRWNPKPLLEQIHRQQITVALLSFSLDDFGWKGGRPAGVFNSLLQSYALVSETSELHIYRPR